MAIPVNSTVLANNFINNYFDSASTAQYSGTGKIPFIENGVLKTTNGLISEYIVEEEFETWANDYLPIGSTTAPSLISGTQSQKLANLTTGTATPAVKGYMSAADKFKLDLLTTATATETLKGYMSTTDKIKLNNLTTYARVGG